MEVCETPKKAPFADEIQRMHRVIDSILEKTKIFRQEQDSVEKEQSRPYSCELDKELCMLADRLENLNSQFRF